MTTPIWRLDKFLNFPNLERSMFTENEDERRWRENAQLQDLVLAAQHTATSRDGPRHKQPASSSGKVEENDKDSNSGGWFSFEALNPFQALHMVGQALVGNNPSDPTSRRQSMLSKRRSSARSLHSSAGSAGHLKFVSQ